jgi:hypothetical protein
LPSLPNLLRYETFAVADYGCMSHALHLRQTQQSLNLGLRKCNTFENIIASGIIKFLLKDHAKGG